MHYDYFFALSRREGELKRLHESLTPGIFNEPAVEFHVRVEYVPALELAGQVEQLDREVFQNATRDIFAMLGDLLEREVLISIERDAESSFDGVTVLDDHSRAESPA